MLIVEMFLVIIILFSILLFSILFLKVLFTNIEYKNSAYRLASGNSFFKTIFDKGNYGEYLIFKSLEKLEGNNKILTNVYVPKEDGSTTEIDLVMLNKSGVYVFESKNYGGWIFGDEKNKNWTQSLKGGKKYKFFNPIRQNKGHINALRKVLTDIRKDYFYSYIVFSERCELKKVSIATSNISVVKRNKLPSVIKIDIEKRPDILSDNQIFLIYKRLLGYSLVDKSIKKKHIQTLKS